MFPHNFLLSFFFVFKFNTSHCYFSFNNIDNIGAEGKKDEEDRKIIWIVKQKL